MTALTIILLIAAGALIAYALIFDGRLQVRETITINRPPAEVFAKVRDLRSWPDWSPWAIHEPDAKYSFSNSVEKVGGSYSWDGKLIGAGTLTHVGITPERTIVQRIEFTRPYKSRCEVGWDFAADGDKTALTWRLQGRLPFALRFLAAMITAGIAKDYQLGLLRLAGLLDDQSQSPELEFPGPVNLPPQRCLVIAGQGSLDQLPKKIGPAMQQLQQKLGQPTGAPLVAYHRADPKKNHFVFDVAYPTDHRAEDGFAEKSLGGGSHLQTRLIGPYRFLHLAWHAAFANLRMRGLKLDAKRPTLEVYENDPRAVEPGQIRTCLYLPIRGSDS